MRFNKISTLSLCAAIVLLSAIFASAQNAQYVGDLDRTFANGGVFQDPTQPDPTLPYPANNITTYFTNGALTADGKIIAGGTVTFQTVENNVGVTRSDFYLRRLLPTGAIDTTFGTNGYVRTNFFTYAPGQRGTSDDSAYKIRLQPDGKIVLLGLCYDNYHYANNGADVNLGTDVCLVRYNADGSLDQSFGGNTISTTYRNVTSTYTFDKGKVFTYTGTKDSEGTQRYNPIPDDLQIQTDGKIVVVGTSGDAIPNTFNNGSTNRPFAFILRYNTDGTLDTTFGSGGEAKYPGRPIRDGAGNITNYTSAEFKAVKIQTDGKIIAVGNDQPDVFAGTYGGRAVVTRYSATGQLELTSFLDDGGLYNQANSVDFLRGNKILVGGISSANTAKAAVARYNSDLSLDTTFGTGGKVTYDGSFTANGTRLNEVGSQYFAIQIIQPDGKFIATDNFGNLFRYNPDGTPDHSFGNGGGNPGDRNYYGFAGTFRSTTPTPGNQTGITFGSALLRPDGRILTFGGIGSNYNAVDGRATVTQQYSFFHSGIYSDFNNDGKTDFSVFRPSNGTWYYLDSFETIYHPDKNFRSVQFGSSADKPVPADYDGDGRTDMAVYRPSNGTWYLLRSAAGFTAIQFGSDTDIAQPADFDGDGKADLVIYRPSNGTWYVLNLANNNFTVQQFGQTGDKPATGDYDGDGRADYAVYRPSNGTWYLLRSTAGFTATQFGTAEDKPVVGDYDGDGRTDLAVYRPSNGGWYLLRSTAGFTGFIFGDQPGDLPAPADFDGDGKFDVTIYRPSTGIWYVRSSLTGSTTGYQFGAPEDRPIPNSYVLP